MGSSPIDTSTLGASALTAQAVQSIDRIHDGAWEIESTGNMMLYTGSNEADGSLVERHLNLNDGSLANIALPGGKEVGSLLRGLNGKIYTTENNVSGGSHVYRMEQDSNGDLQITDLGVWAGENASGTGTAPTGIRLWGNAERHVIGGQLIYTNFNRTSSGISQYYGSSYTVNPEELLLIEHDIPNNEFKQDSIRDMQISGDYMFFFGTDKDTSIDAIMRYNPVTYDFVKFTVDSDLDINRFRVLSSNVIWFEATRLSDQATVIGEMAVDAGGIATVTINDVVDASEPPILVMEAIHPSDFLVIDGDYKDWHTDLRSKTDTASDATAGHDLTYYSEQQSSSNYFGLVEFSSDVISSGDAATVITFDSRYELRLSGNGSTFTDLTAVSPAPVSPGSIGATLAIGKAVEFSIPLSELSGATLTNVSVSRVSVAPLDVASVDAVKNTTNFDVTVVMNTPVDDATVAITLVGNYVLRFTRTTAEIDNNGTVTDLADIVGATIDRGLNDGDNILVVIPETAIGSPVDITPVDQSTVQNVDVLEDGF